MAPALRRSGRRWRSPSRASQASFSQVTITSPNAASTMGLPESRADTLRRAPGQARPGLPDARPCPTTAPPRAAAGQPPLMKAPLMSAARHSTRCSSCRCSEQRPAAGAPQVRAARAFGRRRREPSRLPCLWRAGRQRGRHRQIVSWLSTMYLSSTRRSRRRWRKLDRRHTCGPHSCVLDTGVPLRTRTTGARSSRNRQSARTAPGPHGACLRTFAAARARPIFAATCAAGLQSALTIADAQGRRRRARRACSAESAAIRPRNCMLPGS